MQFPTAHNAEEQFMLDMASDVITDHEDEGCCTVNDPCVIVKAHLDNVESVRHGSFTMKAATERIGWRPSGGHKGGNQYGSYTVRYASPRQVRFVNNLLDQRVIPKTGGEQVALAAFRAGTANLRQTSDLLDWLLTLLKKPREASPNGTASEKQIGLITKLKTERDTSEIDADLLSGPWTGGREGTASALITALFASSKATKPTGGPELESGMYRDPVSGTIYKVYKAVHGSGKMCAKELVVDRAWERDEDGNVLVQGGAHFEYRGLATRFVHSPSWRMTREQAVEFGKIYGVCVRCQATLTLEESIARGMGAVCWGKMA